MDLGGRSCAWLNIFLITMRLTPDSHVVREAARMSFQSGNMECVQFFMSRDLMPPLATCYSQALKSGNLELIKMILSSVNPPNDYAFNDTRSAAEGCSFFQY